MTAELSRERLEEIVSDTTINQGSEFAIMARMLLAGMDSVPVVTDAMALAFHQATTDSSAGSDDIDEIKTGLRAALANYAAPPAPLSLIDHCEACSQEVATWPEWKKLGADAVAAITPPAPVAVPDEKWVNPDIGYADENGFAEGWNACRAAMLKAGPVTAATVLLCRMGGSWCRLSRQRGW